MLFRSFGTVVDWHGSICQAVRDLKLEVSPSEFALAWRSLYQPAMAKVRQGQIAWTSIDVLHRQNLDQILDRFKIRHLSEAQKVDLNLVWHRLKPWPDAVEGLQRLRKGMMICTLSNGNLALLANMAKHAGLPWDLILSAEVFRHYKPDPETYLGVAEIFDLQPSEVMLVAAHEDDLDAAKACGLQTAFVERPDEYGIGVTVPKGDLQRFTYSARDFNDLADQIVR